jgi:hypothetical protein
MNATCTALWISGLCWTSGLQAQAPQTQPGRGIAYSQTQPSAINYECKGTSGSRITCSFTQLDVYKVQAPSVESTLAGSWVQLDAQQCAESKRELEGALKKSSKEPPLPPGRMPGEERRIESLKATVEQCETGSKEAWREFLTREHDRRQKTCTFSAHTYVQTFRREPAGPGNPIHWITQFAPNGECGLQREARFTSDGPAWKYVARYKVMNKSAQQEHLRCGEIKEHEATYSPLQTEDVGWIDCETIQFTGDCYSPDFPCLGGPPEVVH